MYVYPILLEIKLISKSYVHMILASAGPLAIDPVKLFL